MRHFRKQNKCNFLSNIGLLKTAIEEEWNKMSEEFILKSGKLFRRRVDTIIEKKMATILSKSYLAVYFLKWKLILFYNSIIYYSEYS